MKCLALALLGSFVAFSAHADGNFNTPLPPYIFTPTALICPMAFKDHPQDCNIHNATSTQVVATPGYNEMACNLFGQMAIAGTPLADQLAASAQIHGPTDRPAIRTMDGDFVKFICDREKNPATEEY